jgi:hypothetical protein
VLKVLRETHALQQQMRGSDGGLLGQHRQCQISRRI